jgi:Tol biopolymer transport system component
MKGLEPSTFCMASRTGTMTSTRGRIPLSTGGGTLNREALGVRIRSAAWLAVPVAVALLLLAAPAHAAFPGANGRIAFTDGNRLLLVNPDGSGLSEISTNSRPVNGIGWSPDGSTLAYVESADISFVKPDGTGYRTIARPDGIPHSVSWSPDSAKLVFGGLSASFSFSFIDTINVDGSGLQQIARGGPDYPKWSPNRGEIRPILYQLQDSATGGLYTMTSDGSVSTKILGTEDSDQSADWSPDGRRVAFARHGDIYAIGLDGSDLVRITFDGNNGFPAWSPDGTKIAFVSHATGQTEINVINTDGSGQTQITNTARASWPDWQPLPVGSGFARPKGATPFQTYLTVAYKQCTVSNTNRTHGGPLDVLACNPPQQQSMFLTVGTLDANSQAANAVGVYRLDVKSSPADVKMTFALTDVRNQSDLSDYTGELRVAQLWRITDKNNGPISGGGGTDPATNQDLAFPFDVTCAATADETIGSTCDSVSSANAVVPGSIQAGTRMNTQFLSAVNVEDGGSDGVAATTADNTLFMDEGIFVP